MILVYVSIIASKSVTKPSQNYATTKLLAKCPAQVTGCPLASKVALQGLKHQE